MAEMLSIKGLTKHFGEKQVLQGVNLSVPEHSIYGFIGQNGAGKTTTMKIILGLLSADSGEIYVAGEKVSFGKNPPLRFMGYLPDVPEFYGFMTASEYLNFCGEISGMEHADIKGRSAQLLELVGLSGEKHRIKGYSRGMKQRLGIASALLNRPKLLICDEPTSALDPVGRKEILDILMAAREESTVIFSTHILSDVERICDEAAFLHQGKIVCQGSITDMKRKLKTAEEFEVELRNPADLAELMKYYSDSCVKEDEVLIFDESKIPMTEVMGFLSEKKIAAWRIEQREATLENLFLEVVGK